MANKLNNYITNSDLYSQRRNELTHGYETGLEELARQRNRAKIDARRTQEKLMKYMPQVMKNAGIAGNAGLERASMIDMQNQYANNVSEAETQYNSAKNALERSYNSDLSALYSEAQSRMDAEQAEKYDMIKSEMGSWNGTSTELRNYIEQNRESLNENQYANLLKDYEVNAKAIDDAREYEAKLGRIKDISGKAISTSGVNNDISKGDNFRVNVNGENFKVQFGGEVGKNTDAYTVGMSQDNGLFVYDGKVYYKSNDTVYDVERRWLEKDNRSGVNGLDRLIAALMS